MGLVAALIVKNEAAVLRRCLDSLLPHVDKIIVNDNGSTDDTPAILESYGNTVVQVPGEWTDFSTNRNLVLQVARRWGDYVLCGIDADEALAVDGKIELDPAADAYELDLRLGELTYRRTAIVKSASPWRWRYPIHEGLYGPDGWTPMRQHLRNAHIVSHRDGARSKSPDTQAKDLAVLTQAHTDSPDDPRLVFYLAQTLKDMRQFDVSIEYYAKRTRMGGWAEEAWYAAFMIGRCRDWAGQDPTAEYLAAFERNKARAEPLFYAADWYRRANQPGLAIVMATTAAMLPLPEDGLFIERDVYTWRTFDILASCAWWTPLRLLGDPASAMLINNLESVPPHERPRILANHAFYTRM